MCSRYLALACFGLMGLASTARADLFSTLNQSGCCGTGPFGTVLLHVIDANTVQVTETLASGEICANTGAGRSLEFNVDKTFSYVAGTLTTGFTTGGADSASPFGGFTSYVDCGNTLCGNGTSPPNFSGPLTFEITNSLGLTPNDFIANSGGYYFASDLGVPKPTGGGFNSGNVGSNSVVVVPSVPEPSSLLLFGTVAASMLGLLRRIRA